jgi:hypothetical protein
VAHGYPEITPQLRAKVFGLNAIVPYRIQVEEVLRSAAGDPIGRVLPEYLEHPRPHFRTYGPRTRREFLRLLRVNGGRIS